MENLVIQPKIILSEEQEEVLDFIINNTFQKEEDSFICGYAGTGKSVLISELCKRMGHHRLSVAAFTNIAAKTLRDKGIPNVRTIHSLIYKTESARSGKLIARLPYEHESTPAKECSVLIFDECSMIDADMYDDIKSYGIPCVFFGDMAQLPPVVFVPDSIKKNKQKKKEYLEDRYYFQVTEPDKVLTKVFRQAEGDPILDFITGFRLDEPAKSEGYGSSVTFVKDAIPAWRPELKISMDTLNKLFELFKDDFALICGTNKLRMRINEFVREKLGYNTPVPQKGEKIITLENFQDICNGSIYTVLDVSYENESDNVYYVWTEERQKPFKVQAKNFLHGFPDLAKQMKPIGIRTAEDAMTDPYIQADFAYVISCHKAQGSQWEKVCVLDESRVFGEYAKNWFYTAISRASKQLFVFKQSK